MSFEYFVTVFDDQSTEATWHREVFTTLSAAMKYATKYVRDGWEARVFKSKVDTKPKRPHHKRKGKS